MKNIHDRLAPLTKILDAHDIQGIKRKGIYNIAYEALRTSMDISTIEMAINREGKYASVAVDDLVLHFEVTSMDPLTIDNNDMVHVRLDRNTEEISP